MSTSELSMNEMPFHDHQQDWSDEHITVTFKDFVPITGRARFKVSEHHANVGFYYIGIYFTSGSGTRVDYDGGNPNRPSIIEGTTNQRNDSLKGIKVKRVRD
jgi:hypothetical protein